MQAPAEFHWIRSDGTPAVGTGRTRDVSTSGIFIEAIARPTFGSRITCEILLPPANVTAQPLRIEATGNVVRHESADERVGGFAVATDALSLYTARINEQMDLQAPTSGK